MSKGIYIILDSYSGEQDSYLVLTKQLRQRLKQIEEENKKRNLEDVRPTVKDISQTHNFAMVSTYRPHVAIAYEYFKTLKGDGGITQLVDGTNTTKIRFNLQGNEGHWLNDMVVRVLFQEIGIKENAPEGSLRYRYCDLPGMRLFERTTLNVDNLDIADYVTDDISFNDFHVQPSKKIGYYRSLGREDTLQGEFYMVDQQVKQKLEYKNGAQTPKFYQPKLELWIPLLFWFNRDVSSSLNNILIRTAQRNIDIYLAPLRRIIQAIDVNDNVVSSGITGFKIEGIELYTKNIYVNSEIHDLFMNRRLMSVIKINKRHIEILSGSEGEIHLSGLKYGIEYLKFGFKPLENEESFDNWHKYSKITVEELPHVTVINNPIVNPVQQVVIRTIKFLKCGNVVEKVGFKAFGVELYPMLSPAFYNQHIPLMNEHIVTPDDCGKMIAPFNLLPGGKMMTGYLQTSRAKEFYLKYDSENKINQNNKVKLFVSAEALAFLYYDGFSIYLKYIT